MCLFCYSSSRIVVIFSFRRRWPFGRALTDGCGGNPNWTERMVLRWATTHRMSQYSRVPGHSSVLFFFFFNTSRSDPILYCSCMNMGILLFQSVMRRMLGFGMLDLVMYVRLGLPSYRCLVYLVLLFFWNWNWLNQLAVISLLDKVTIQFGIWLIISHYISNELGSKPVYDF